MNIHLKEKALKKVAESQPEFVLLGDDDQISSKSNRLEQALERAFDW